MIKDKSWEEAEELEQIKEELFLLAESIKDHIAHSASTICKDGLVVFEGYDDGYRYVISRAKSHNRQKELAKDLEGKK